MPLHNSKSKAKKKRDVLAEQPSPVTLTPHKNKGLAYATKVVHNPQDLRAPQDESSYIHRARPTAPPLSRGQTEAIAMFQRGNSLTDIAKSTGLPSGTLKKTLAPVGLSEDIHKVELEELAEYYATKRNNI